MHRLKWHYPLPCQNTSTVSSCKLVRTVTASGQNVSILCMNYPLQTDESLSLPQHVISNLQRSYEQMLGYIIKIFIITIFSNVVLKCQIILFVVTFQSFSCSVLLPSRLLAWWCISWTMDLHLIVDSSTLSQVSWCVKSSGKFLAPHSLCHHSPRRIIRCKQKLGGKQGNHVIHWPCGHGPGAFGDVWLTADESEITATSWASAAWARIFTLYLPWCHTVIVVTIVRWLTKAEKTEKVAMME